ncbi:FHA domain-containing protein [Hirsutella rhossiliensis]|uniref:RING-type E3 ubiquitin transferase n=1 Tax=Hirsutella rhossiliensis TaxID=111463 RepID=A0A9P8MRL2_9HYPO|nr:FHA domain-containing protein [Hirsutella rhossiliensis]KAH0959995.1 FHA domain-containing protein [Hirsutella rhossiliensis]
MFTQPVSSPPPGPQSATPVTTSRPSRLRGLSYLRNYTHNHLLSRDTHHSAASPAASPHNLTRSVSYSLASTAAHGSNRLTLINSTPDAPLRPRAPQMRASSASPIPETTAVVVSDPRDASPSPPQPQQSQLAPMARTTASPAEIASSASPDTAPSIRFSAYYDPRSTRPSLSFAPISRTLPAASDVIRVGRYSERDGQAAATMLGSQPSAAPVGFKSKVVSRRHCEFWCEDGKWYIRDVKSSSGTFLNHIRLSPPSQESKAYPVNDGDIVQLGIDFKGGEEMIFRCVKMRLELNRGWQNKLNTFNVAAHKRLRTMASNGAASALSSSNSQDCSICLNSIAPCQSLFVAPCSHTWHFKCVRSLLTSPQYPIFVCPNCRAGADLEADVDEPSDEWQQLEEEGRGEEDVEERKEEPSGSQSPASAPEPADVTVQDADAVDVTVAVGTSESPAARPPLHHATTEPLPISSPVSGAGRVGRLRENGSPSLGANGEGLVTPRNNAGPWVFDGSAGRRAVDATTGMRSLDAAAEMGATSHHPSDDSS